MCAKSVLSASLGFFIFFNKSELGSHFSSLSVLLCLILGLQSISRDVADNVSLPRRLDPTMELITYSFVLYLQHGRHDVKCKRSIQIEIIGRAQAPQPPASDGFVYLPR